jgi:ferredoxin
MTHVITSKCARVGACVDVCPTDSIHAVEDNAEWPTYYISPDSCIDCGACLDECPEEAIFVDDDTPAEFQALIAKNEEFFTEGPGKGLV